MTRIPTLAAALAAAVLLAPALALAQSKAPAEPRRIIVRQAQGGVVQPARTYALGQAGMGYVPGYHQLATPAAQEELELVPEQIEKLKEIGKKYREQMQADRNVWKDWQKMTAEERKAKSAEIREKYKKRAENAKAEMEKVLLPHQIKMLAEMNFRTRAPYSLRNPKTLEQIGVTDEQKEKLKTIREKLMQQYQELQKKSLQETLDVLTPEQKEKLKEQIKTRGY